MTPLDTRALVRLALNWRCSLLALMLWLGLREEALFALLAGSPYPGERGIGTAARRYGTVFDTNLAADGAVVLLQAIAAVTGIDPATAVVRDLRTEVPGGGGAARRERLRRTRQILADGLHGHPAGDVVLQPTLELPIRSRRVIRAKPDALILDAATGLYQPLEAKAYPALNGVIEPGDRRGMRLQAAAQLLALRHEYAQWGAAGRVRLQALLLVGSPFGLTSEPAVREDLAAEVVAIGHAIQALARVGSSLDATHTQSEREARLHQAASHYQDSCPTQCALASYCRRRAPGLRGALGDLAAGVGGDHLDLARIVALLAGDPPADAQEAQVLVALRETAALYGWGWA